MSRLFRLGRVRFVLAAAAAMLLCGHARAQIVITNASIASLQNALISGITNIALQFNGTITTTTPLEIVEDTVLDGTGFGVTINGNSSSQIFFVDPGVNFTLINVTLSGANNTGQAGAVGVNGGNGGGTGGTGGAGGAGTNGFGGAVYNQGNSSFIGVLFLTNAVAGGAGGAGGNGGNGSNFGGTGGAGGNGGAAYGGAIYNLGTILLSNCTVAGNVATGGTAGVGGTNGSGPFASYPGAGGAGGPTGGAGIYNLGKATIVNTTLNQNGCFGGASQTGGGPTGSSQNGGAGAVGGISQGAGISNLGTNTLLNCTFFANTATGGTGGNGGNGNTNSLGKGGTGGNGGNAIGGGIYNAAGAIIAITNCTFSGDVVTGGTNGLAGFGPFAGANGSPGTPLGANIANGNTGATFLLKNTILAAPTNATSANGTITDQGNNLSSDATPVFSTTNSFNKDPKLSPTGLAGNGTTTVLTIGLSANSPAINAIFDGSAPAFDERGFVRPGQIRPDIGAFEFGTSFTNFNVSGRVTIGGNAFPGIKVNAGNVQTVSDTNGFFQFSLTSNNLVNISPVPSAYFSPASTNVLASSNISGLVFNATNAIGTVSNNVGTNTNTLSITFAGIPNFTYRIQAATNFSTNTTVWTNLATNVSNTTNGAVIFSYSLQGTNLTNFPRRFFRAITP